MTPVQTLLKGLPHHSPVYGSGAWLDDPGHYPAYAALFARLAPESLLEIGTFLGYSLVAALAGSPRLETIFFVDDESALAGSNAMARENALSAGRGLGRDSLSVRYARPQDAVVLGTYDVVHVDGDHAYGAVKSDLAFAASRAAKFIVGHDYRLPGSGVKRAVDEFCAARGLYGYEEAVTNGVFVIEMGAPNE